MGKRLQIVALCCFAGPAAAQTIVDNSGADIPDALKSAVAQRVADKFKDPGSTQLRRLGIIPSKAPDTDVICGQVNSKNSYGAYAGFQFFTFIREKSVTVVHLDKIELMMNGTLREDLVAPYIKVGCLP